MQQVRYSLLAIGVFLLPLMSGCSTVARQAVAEVRGAKAEVEPLQSGGTASGAMVRFRPARAEVSQGAVTTMASAFDGIARKVEEKYNRGAAAGGSTVEIDVRVIYYKAKGMFDSALMLARAQAHEGGRMVLDAYVRTESKAFRADESDIAEKTAEAVAAAATGRKPGLLGDGKDDDD